MSLKTKRFSIIAVLVISAICIIGTLGASYIAWNQAEKELEPSEITLDEYQQAINDSVIADENEIHPLVEISSDSEQVIWNEEKDRVLLLTFHKYPDSYVPGEEAVLEWGSVWTTSKKEFMDWYEEQEEVTNWELRLKQLLGMPEDNQNTHMTAMWVRPEDIIRPAYVTDITKQMSNHFDWDNPEDEEYLEWFNENAVEAYCDNTFPWTRLGYTYDWADNGTEYGLSEFLVNQGATVIVEATDTVEAFIQSVDSEIK